MAINERPNDWDNAHTLLSMRSGGGKSLFMRSFGLFPSKGARCIFWDIDRDHKCTHYTKRSEFLKALIRCDKSGKGFRIGWAGDNERKTYEWFLDCVWAVLDGTKATYLNIEELADCSKSAGQATGIEKTIMNRSRKYGGIFTGVTQRPQEISKTVFSACVKHVVGITGNKDIQYVSDATGAPVDQIKALKKYNRKQPDSDNNCCQYLVVEDDGDKITRVNIWPKSGKITYPKADMNL